MENLSQEEKQLYIRKVAYGNDPDDTIKELEERRVVRGTNPIRGGQGRPFYVVRMSDDADKPRADYDKLCTAKSLESMNEAPVVAFDTRKQVRNNKTNQKALERMKILSHLELPFIIHSCVGKNGEKDRWCGIYDSNTNTIKCDNYIFPTLHQFAKHHYARERPDRTSNVNAWKECECWVNQKWIKCNEAEALLSRNIQC